MALGCPTCRAVFRSEFLRCPRDGAALGVLDGDPLIGETIGDRYVIIDLLGEGAMGRVYRARHKRVSRQFAIKVLFGDHAADPKMRSRFAREAEAASRVNHANVVSVVDFGETDVGLLYLAMDYVEGESLSREIATVGALGDERAATLTRQLASGLAHAHAQGLVHRDFKGENVILTRGLEGEIPKIVDFGIAVLADPEERGNRLTTQGMVVGTPAYMAPEQATGEGVDARSDLFSLGVLMYEMLSGVLPFSGSPMEVARQNLAADAPPIAVRVPGLVVSPKLEAIAFRLMEKMPSDRYQHALEVIDALDGAAPEPAREVAIGGDPSAAETQDIWQLDADDALPGARRKRVILAVCAVGLLGFGGFALAGGLSGSDGPKPESQVTMQTAKPSSPAESATPAPKPPEPTPTLAATDPSPLKEEAEAAAKAKPPPTTRTHRKKTARRDRRGHRRSQSKQRPRESEPEQQGPSLETLTRRYVAVGRAIDRLSGKRGGAVASPLRREYFAIPYQDALRDPALRKEAYRKLRALGRKVNRALKR